MQSSLHILNANNHLTFLEPRIRVAVEAALAGISQVLPLPGVDIVIDSDSKAAIPETGVGGYAPNAHRIDIHIDPTFPRVEQALEREIKSTLAHELHHCARWAGIGYGDTLIEHIVSEGLADHFDLEVNGGTPKPWSLALTDTQLKVLFKEALQASKQNAFSQNDWFFGAKKDIPRWTGYSLGFSIVGKYLRQSRKKASALVNEPAQTFLEGGPEMSVFKP